MSMFLLSLAVKGTLVLALAASAVYVLRRSPASLRHCIWTAAFATLLATPALDGLGPAWSVAVLPSAPPAPITAATSARALPTESPTRAITPPDEPAARMESTVPLALPAERSSETVAVPSSSPVPTASRGETAAAAPASALTWLGRLWALGAVAVGLFWLRGFVLGRRLVRAAQVVSDTEWSARVRAAARTTGLPRPVRLLRSDALSVPVAWGWGRPTVVLPRQSDEWDVERLDAVLLHEMAHLRRRDAWTQVIAQAALALHWPNPLAWIAYRRFIDAREEACDDAVLRVGAAATDYAAHLVAVARELTPSRPMLAALTPMASRGGLETRVRSILDHRRSRRQLGRWALGTTLLLAGLVGGPLALFHPVPASAAPAGADAPRMAPSESAPAARDTLPDPERVEAVLHDAARDALRSIREASPEGDDAAWAAIEGRVLAGVSREVDAAFADPTARASEIMRTLRSGLDETIAAALANAESEAERTVLDGAPDIEGRVARAMQAALRSLDTEPARMAQRDGGIRHLVVLGEDHLPLVDRWRKAREVDEVQITWPAWMVWGIENPRIRGLHSNARRYPSEGATFAAAAADVLPGDLPNVLFMVLVSERGTVEAIRLRSPDVPVDLVDQTVFWLGAASDAQSRALFDRLYTEVRDPGLRSEVAAAYAIHTDSRAVLDVVGRMIQSDPSPLVREEAVQWLPRGHPSVPGVVPVLVRAVENDASASVRQEATEALALLDSPSARRAVRRFADAHPDSGVRDEAIEGIVRAQARGPEPVSTLVRTIEEDRRAQMRDEALDQLSSLDTPTALAAVRRLARTHPDADLRREAVEHLARSQPASPETVAALLQVVNTDPNVDVRLEAVEALADLNTTAARNAVRQLARTHTDPRIRSEAVEGLIQSGNRADAVSILVSVVETDADADVRREAVESLGDLDTPDAWDAVRRFSTDHPDPRVRREAVESLGTARPTRPETITALLQVVDRDPDMSVRREAVETLGDLDTPSALNAVRRLATAHPDPEIRSEAVESLGKSDSPAVRSVLEGIVESDANSQVRQEAIEALVHLSTPEAWAAVRRFSTDHSDVEVRVEAAESLARR